MKENNKVQIIEEIPEMEYQGELIKIRSRIENTEQRIIRHNYSEMILEYYDIGTYINERKEWGDKYILRLSNDLKDKKGMSYENLYRMSRVARTFSKSEIMSQFATQIPWFSLITIMSKCKDKQEKLWYIEKTYENGWSRSKLIEKIKSNAYELEKEELIMSKGLKEYNHPEIKKMIKSNYTFSSISKKDFNSEREFKDKLISRIIDVLKELGQGFALVGKEYQIEQYKLDLLFYNFIMHTFFVIEVKIGEYKYQDYGQLVFYVNLVDKKLKSEKESNSIGILICKDVDKTIVKYTIENSEIPIALTKYLLKEDLGK